MSEALSQEVPFKQTNVVKTPNVGTRWSFTEVPAPSGQSRPLETPQTLWRLELPQVVGKR